VSKRINHPPALCWPQAPCAALAARFAASWQCTVAVDSTLPELEDADHAAYDAQVLYLTPVFPTKHKCDPIPATVDCDSQRVPISGTLIYPVLYPQKSVRQPAVGHTATQLVCAEGDEDVVSHYSAHPCVHDNLPVIFIASAKHTSGDCMQDSCVITCEAIAVVDAGILPCLQ
jgi:hypothetical protein